MTKELDSRTRGLLEFRPKIEFIEPDVRAVAPQPIPEPRQPDKVIQQLDQTRKMANAVNVLATALQAKADVRAANMYIDLTMPADAAAVSALRRAYPNDDPSRITYDQYRQCKNHVLDKALSLTEQGLSMSNPKALEQARKNPSDIFDPSSISKAAMFGTDMAKHGGLRPEADSRNQILKGVDVAEYQDTSLNMLINFLWKKFIKPTIPLPPGVGVLPDEIAPVNDKFKNMMNNLGAPVLGGKKPKKTGAQELPTIDLNNRPVTNTNQPVQASVVSSPDKGQSGKFVKGPEPLEMLDIADCQTIQKTFERGAAYCATEESVFAMLTPTLSNIRIISGAFEKIWDSNDAILTQDLGETAGDVVAPFTDVNLSDNKDVLRKWKECMPCEFDFKLAGDFFSNLVQAFLNGLKIDTSFFQQLLDTLNKISEMFKLNPVDICALWEWMKSGVCVPDLRKIIAAFMSLIMQMAFELTSLMNMILTLVTPLLLPFLLGVITPLEQLFLLIIKPLECVIRNIVNLMSKADYQSVFDERKWKTQIGPAGKGTNINVPIELSKLNTPPLPIPGTDKTIPSVGSLQNTQWEQNIPGYSWTNKWLGWDGSLSSDMFNLPKLDEQRAVEEAESEVQRLIAEQINVDPTNTDAARTHQAKLEAARGELARAQEERDFNVIKAGQEKVKEFGGTILVVLDRILSYIRRAITSFQNFLNNLVKEIRKMLQDFLGGNGQMVFKLYDKLALVQIMSIITSLIAWVQYGSCNDADVEFAPLAISQEQSGLSVYTDEQGNINIEEDPQRLADALNTVAESFGKSPEDVVNMPLTQEGTRQKIKSLLQLTGDPLLDTEILRTLDSIVLPTKVKFHCPLKTSLAEAEKVNKWIAELNSV